MPEPVELKGRPASPGIAAGPLFRLDAEIARRLPTGDPARERDGARRARSRAAIEQIDALLAAAERRAARHPRVPGRDARGRRADRARPSPRSTPATAPTPPGSRRSTTEIAGYETSDDDYFRARAADLVDLRDRVLRNLSGADVAAAPPGAILAGDDLTPSRFLATDWRTGGGIALAGGSPTSHVAMLARARGVPMVVGLGAIAARRPPARRWSTATAARVVLSPGHAQRSYVEMRRAAHRRATRERNAAICTRRRAHRRRHADRRDGQRRAAGGARRARRRDLRRRRPDAHRVPVHRRRACPTRRRSTAPTPRCSTGRPAGRSPSAPSTPAATSRSRG